VVEGLESRELLAFTPLVPTPFPALTPRPAQVAQIPTTLTLIGPVNPVTVGQVIPYQAVVGISSGTTPPTGTVTFAVDGVAQPPAIVNSVGIATVMLPPQTAGSHVVTASYSGNFLYAPSFAMTTQQVNQVGQGAPPATVVSVQRFGFHLQPTVLQIAFSSPMDATRARNPANYRIVGPGGNLIPVLSAAYDPVTERVTLLPSRRLNLHVGYVLVVVGSGPNGLTDAAGVPLAGSRGVPGTNYRTHLTAANLVIPGKVYFTFFAGLRSV